MCNSASDGLPFWAADMA
ncbi:Protein of unknown function [Anaplasma phagocytophilum]|uniref:Uncharacterized protein n=1 Tax=Anaplasma phagocytophilum TaxID=948 RepID=A0A098EG78_ANAPH|nr:Protein of unknown function [Anaplasma phagocytophilum]